MSLMNRSHNFRLVRNIPAQRLPENRFGITLVWLENISCSSCDDNQIRLHSFSNRCFIVYYSNISKCIKYLKRVRSREYVIAIIVSYPMESTQRIIHRLQQLGVIQTIFVVYSVSDPDNHLSLIADNFHVFQNHELMFELLEKRIQEVEEQNLNGGLFTTFYRKEKSLKDVREDLAIFAWTHVFKVLLMSMPRDSLEAKRQMLSECRAYYRNDAVRLAQINEFERKYQSKDAIWWYTKPGFLFYLVNKALRSQDIWVLYKFRYFIIDLCCRLEEVSSSQSFSSIRLYRGAKLNRDELKHLQVGCLVSTNGFFSCSSDRNVAEMFIGTDLVTDRSSSRDRDACQQFVLFIIDVDRRTSTNIVVADVSHESELPDENEMIFNFGSTFIINEICFDNDKCIWLIQMSSSSDNARINDEQEKYTRERLQHINPTIMFGHALADTDSDFSQSMSYFHRLLRILPIDHMERPNIYYYLGRIYRFIEKFEESLNCFRCARLLVRRLLPERMFDYCRILGGLGTIYSHLEDSERALKLLTQALMLQKKSLPKNHTEIPFHLNRLGHAYFKVKQYDLALSILDSAENFFQTKMPIAHQGYAHTLHTMGLVYRALSDDKKAVIYFQEALRIRYASLVQVNSQITRPDNGICARAKWAQNATTVAGGHGQGSELNQLNFPYGFFLDDNQTIYVADSANHRVVKWERGVSKGQLIAGGKGTGDREDQLYNPSDVVVDKDGTIYISDYKNRRVQRWSPNAQSGQTIIGDISAFGIVKDDQGSLYVSDFRKGEVRKWRMGETVGQVIISDLSQPSLMFVDRNRSVFVTETGSSIVTKVDDRSTRMEIAAGALYGDGDDELASPMGVIVDQLGTVYVADSENNRIMRWPRGAKSGSLIAGGHEQGSQSDQLNYPTDLSFDLDGNLYVMDNRNHRVQKFAIDKITAQGCGPNEIQVNCASLQSCQPTCEKPQGMLCPRVCAINSCVCKDGFVRDDENNLQCIEQTQCHTRNVTEAPICGENEVYSNCTNPCQPSCEEPNREPCETLRCSEGCVCSKDYLRATNDTTSPCIICTN
ncbi:unnamed protein product [Rotaria sordida]|uniref:Uncharacterized protein n=1 Tax=Rotaria sordida TaxID=392033 RepID=A0A815D7H5_9BILA|nr:unnamed protein product [Rotaria sordida]